jgi:hypothetical protein
MISWLYFRYEVKQIEQERVENSDLLGDIAGDISSEDRDCIPSTSLEQRSHATTPILFVSYSDDSESDVDYADDERDSYSDLDLGMGEVYSNDDQIQENFQYQKYHELNRHSACKFHTSDILLSILCYISKLHA